MTHNTVTHGGNGNGSGTMRAEPVRVMAVIGAGRGRGSTTVAVNLAAALANRGHATTLVDAGASYGGVNRALGLRPHAGLAEVARGETAMRDVALSGPDGMTVIPATDGIADLSQAQCAGLISALDELPAPDVLVLDLPPEVTPGMQCFLQAVTDVIVVLGDQPASLCRAHALIERLSAAGVSRFRVLVERAESEACGRELFDRLARYLEEQVDVALHYIGSVPNDPQVGHAWALRCPVVDSFPRTEAAWAFRSLARRVERWAPPVASPTGAAFHPARKPESHIDVARVAQVLG